MAVSLMGIPVADEPKDSVMWKEADAFMAQMSPTLQPTQRDAIFTAINGNTKKLENVRNARNSKPTYPANVKVTEPAGNLRLYTPTTSTNNTLLIYRQFEQLCPVLQRSLF